MDTNIVFDLGGTKMRIAAFGSAGLEEVHKVPTPRNPKDGLVELIRLAHEAAGTRRIAVVVGGVPGIVSEGILHWLPNLSHWNGLNLKVALEKELGAHVRIEHDTAVIGLAEVHEGAGKGSRICAYVTVSTGVGGDRIIDGAIDQSTYGFEIGHQLVNGEELEALVSGTAIKKKFGIEPMDLDSLEEREKLADLLAIGLYNTTLHWSPDTIVVGGSMIVGKNPIPLTRVESELTRRLSMYPTVPALKMAMLADDGGLRGSAILAAQLATQG